VQRENEVCKDYQEVDLMAWQGQLEPLVDQETQVILDFEEFLACKEHLEIVLMAQGVQPELLEELASKG